MRKVSCTVDGCVRLVGVNSRSGICSFHGQRLRLTGTTNDPSRVSPLHRFLVKIELDRESGCWLWKGRLSRGYARFSVGGRTTFVHRWSYEAFVAPIPEGLEIDHLCRTPRCVNPSHLEPVTGRENLLRGFGMPARNARKIACKRGHPLTSGNLYLDRSGYRQCRACMRIRDIANKRKRGVRERVEKFAESDIVLIRERVASGEGLGQVARDYNVSKSTICNIANRKTWAHVS